MQAREIPDLPAAALANGAGKDTNVRDSQDLAPIVYALGDTEEKLEAMRVLLRTVPIPMSKLQLRPSPHAEAPQWIFSRAELLLDHGARPDGDPDDEATPL